MNDLGSLRLMGACVEVAKTIHWIYKLGNKGEKDKEHMLRIWDTCFYAHSSMHVHKNENCMNDMVCFFQLSNLPWLPL